MVYIFILLIIIGIIVSLLGWLANLVGGAGNLIIIVVVLAAAYLVFSWEGVFTVIGVAVVGLLIIRLLGRAGTFLVGQLGRAGTFLSRKLEQHDNMARETAMIKRQTQAERQTHENDQALMEELNKNCFWLGCMNADKWKKKLPNFVGKNYSTSFDTITANFAKQIEQQHIIQNNDWFEPYMLYVLDHPGGSTVTKMLNEVNCPQLKMTHITPDGDLINTWLVRGTKRVSKDVPELFRMTFIKDINENVFTPTEYLKKLYGDKSSNSRNDAHVEEINFDDL